MANLPVEKPLRIYVNDKYIVTLMATPERIEELAYGWLWSNDLISTAREVHKIFVDIERAIVFIEISGDLPEVIERTVSSGCGGGAMISDYLSTVPEVKSDLRISLKSLVGLQTQFMQKAIIYKETGGVHGAALSSSEDILFTAEDIGRHNTVDKVIGWSLINKLDLKNTMIFTTGRISSEMLFKVAKASLPIVITRTAATDLAVKLAEKAGVTIVGYLRKNRAEIYSHPENIES